MKTTHRPPGARARSIVQGNPRIVGGPTGPPIRPPGILRGSSPPAVQLLYSFAVVDAVFGVLFLPTVVFLDPASGVGLWWNELSGVLNIGRVLFLLWTVICVGRWLARTRRLAMLVSAAVGGASPQDEIPAMVWWYFLPIASFWMPCCAFRRLQEVSARLAGEPPPSPLNRRVWWGSFLMVFNPLWFFPGAAALSAWMLVRLMDDVARQKAIWPHRQDFLTFAE